MSEQVTGLEYLIPRKIRQGYEFAPGWGIPQVVAAFAGIVAGAMVAALMHLIRAPLFLQFLPLVVLGGIGVMVARPLPDGSTVLDLLAAYRAWSRRPRRYLYDWSRDDWPE